MRNKNKSLEAFHVANKMHILGPQQREFRKEILQTMQVGGAPTKKLTKRNSTNNASWGGPQHKEILFL
ncbi:hypothetical protein UG86_03845 [Staphylococcus aureus]|uniref:Nitrogen regulation protein NIFR3 n=1 Tax=Staphylococcus aureus TaxID=1280 RepID=A0A7Z1N3C6_STAAU|nr:hypothetical protein [Staphylococcus aureus]EWC67085.1 hypothetical protein W893_02115 [Staphylococcus aureus subsp. aureus ST 1413]AJP65207.1 hypothetical protein UG86_03845 [Staphylococcus aureus]AUU50355.1 hypothetical protein RK79_006030 [Staphylococcus aureus]MCU4275874.1 hypothetical protein [Staphylococcus aureus]MSN67283.1 hypothetical protein [Staphylococcus aureus]